MKKVLEKINNQVNLSMGEMQDAMNQIMSGKVNDIDMESFLIGLNIKGISEEEITAAGMIMSCLLYTSPSPRDGLLSRMPSSA